MNRPEVQTFLQPLLNRRAKDLNDAMSKLKLRLENYDEAKAVWRHIHETLSLPGDTETPAANELVAAGNQRVAAIDRAAFEAMYSKRELELMNDQGRIVVPEEYDPPTPDEIRLVIARELGQVLGSRTGPYQFKLTMDSLAEAFTGGGFIIDVKPVTVLATANYEDAYATHYQYKARGEIVGGKQNWLMEDPGAAMLVNITLNLLNNQTHEYADEFILTEQGWRSPTMLARAREDKMQYYQNMAKNLERALPRYRFIYIRR